MKLYRIFDTVKKAYVAVRGGRKGSWRSFPSQAIASIAQLPEKLEVHEFTAVKTATLTADRQIIKTED